MIKINTVVPVHTCATWVCSPRFVHVCVWEVLHHSSIAAMTEIHESLEFRANCKSPHCVTSKTPSGMAFRALLYIKQWSLRQFAGADANDATSKLRTGSNTAFSGSIFTPRVSMCVSTSIDEEASKWHAAGIWIFTLYPKEDEIDKHTSSQGVRRVLQQGFTRHTTSWARWRLTKPQKTRCRHWRGHSLTGCRYSCTQKTI